jgi:hypothetical protein
MKTIDLISPKNVTTVALEKIGAVVLQDSTLMIFFVGGGIITLTYDEVPRAKGVHAQLLQAWKESN